MEALRPTPEGRPVGLEFSVGESSESTEFNKVLFYSRNGFTFRADLDLREQTVRVTLEEKREESLDQDWQVLQPHVEKQATEKLYEYRDEMSGQFA